MSKYSNEFKIKVVNAAGDVNKTRKSIFDYIQENGTIEQLEKAYKIYGDTDFNKKSEAVSSLKQLLELTKKD